MGCTDSTRTEAGLPLYGHELAGPFGISPTEAGFPGYIKYHKPFFIGRSAFIAHKAEMKGQVIRFRVNDKNVRLPKQLDLIADKRGKVVGKTDSIGGTVADRINTLAGSATPLSLTGTSPTVSDDGAADVITVPGPGRSRAPRTEAWSSICWHSWVLPSYSAMTTVRLAMATSNALQASRTTGNLRNANARRPAECWPAHRS